jgi:hypothetical protein
MHRLSLLVTIRLVLGTSLILPALPVAAESLTWSVWAPYQDKIGLIHSVLVDKTTRGPSTANGLLYTSEACVIMQLRNVAYDRNAIAATMKACEVKPGLFRRSPVQTDQEGPDDYIGLGALAGVCGFHDIAKDILEYGNTGEQTLREAVLGLDPVSTGKGWLRLLRQGLSGSPAGSVVPYNYNNVEPGKFTIESWMGRFPAIIIHWKLAAGERPSGAELIIWSAALEYSARHNMDKDSPQDPWLQSWLMVLTYQTSGFRSAVADAAVKDWWNLLFRRWPGGIKEAMTAYLGAGAAGNPLSEFIDDFKDARGASGDSIDVSNSEEDLVSSVEGLLSDLSPTDFLAPFNKGLSDAQTGIRIAQQTLDAEKQAVDAAAAAVNDANGAVSKIENSVANLNAQKAAAANRLASSIAQKADMLSRGLDKIVTVAGHFETPTHRVFGVDVPLGPPIWVPPVFGTNSAYESLGHTITDLTSVATNLDNQIAGLGQEKEQAVRNQTIAIAKLANTKVAVSLGEDGLKKARAALDKAQDGVAKAQSVVLNLVPGIPLPVDP